VSRSVILNADDFGLSPAVNRGILEAFGQGVLTSTTALVNLPGFRDAVRIAREHPELAVGVHLSLLWGPPVSPPHEVPSLVAADGCFPAGVTTLARRYLLRRLSLAEVRLEFSRQIGRFREAGLQPTHVDTHKHVHALPGVLEALIAAASTTSKRCGCPSRTGPRSREARGSPWARAGSCAGCAVELGHDSPRPGCARPITSPVSLRPVA